MSLNAVAGQKIYIGGQLDDKSTDFVAADFSSQTWVEIDGWETCGKAGDSSALISTDLINRGRTIKQKGVKNAGQMQNQFALVPGDAGQAALLAASLTNKNYAFKVQNNDAASVTTATVTVTIASPGVFTDAAHGLSIGSAVSFSTTGALPTGLVAGTTYYIIATGFTTGAYSVAATAGGSAIVTSGTQSGVHTRTSVPASSQRLFVGLVMTAEEPGGSANTVQMLGGTIEINSNIVKVAKNP